MGIREIATALGVSPALICHLVKRGMPTTTTTAANAWRAIHAPPRRRKAKVQ